MTPPPPAPPTRPQAPHRTERATDRLVPLFAAAAAVSVCVLLWAPGASDPTRPPVFFGSWLAGLLLARLYGHRYRGLGFVPLAATAALAVALVAEFAAGWSNVAVGLFCGLLGFGLGAVLRYRDQFRANLRQLLLAAAAGLAVGVALIAAFSAVGGGADDWRAAYRWLLLALTAVVAALGWLTLFLPFVELAMEVPMRPMYRFTAAGPGWAGFPRAGPVVVIANHAAYFDPVFVGKMVPRPTTPLMTATFYDKPFLRPLMTRVLNVIRVPEIPLRRNAPEIQEAIAALDLGKCVVIFPEGYLRRGEDKLLRRFGQGIWQVLKARPDTPVVACWIEGSWGSYFSFADGPPTRNKKRDFRRPIGVAAAAPEAVPAEVLAEGLRTRIYLMNKVLAARKYLGLPDAPPVELPARGEREEE